MKKKLGMTFSLVSGEEEVAEVVEKLVDVVLRRNSGKVEGSMVGEK